MNQEQGEEYELRTWWSVWINNMVNKEYSLPLSLPYIFCKCAPPLVSDWRPGNVLRRIKAICFFLPLCMYSVSNKTRNFRLRTCFSCHRTQFVFWLIVINPSLSAPFSLFPAFLSFLRLLSFLLSGLRWACDESHRADSETFYDQPSSVSSALQGYQQKGLLVVCCN